MKYYFSVAISGLFALYTFVILALVEKLPLLKAGFAATIFFVLLMIINAVLNKDIDQS